MQHDNLKSTTFLSVNFNLVRSTITRMGDTYEVNSKCTYRTYSEGGIPCLPPIWNTDFLFGIDWGDNTSDCAFFGWPADSGPASSRTLYLTKQFLSRLLRRTHIERVEYRAHGEPRVDRTPSVVEAATALGTHTTSLPSFFSTWSIEDQILLRTQPSANRIWYLKKFYSFFWLFEL